MGCETRSFTIFDVFLFSLAARKNFLYTLFWRVITRGAWEWGLGWCMPTWWEGKAIAGGAGILGLNYSPIFSNTLPSRSFFIPRSAKFEYISAASSPNPCLLEWALLSHLGIFATKTFRQL